MVSVQLSQDGALPRFLGGPLPDRIPVSSVVVSEPLSCSDMIAEGKGRSSTQSVCWESKEAMCFHHSRSLEL